MDLTVEQENFCRLHLLFNECILPKMRDFFIEVWERQFPTSPWPDSTDNPNRLVDIIKTRRIDAFVTDRILNQELNDWDITCVSKALLALNLSALETECIRRLKDARNMISHRSSGKFTENENDDILIEVDDVYGKLAWPKDIFKKFQRKDLAPAYVKQLKAKLDNEERAALKEDQENLCKLPPEISNFVGREEQLKESSEILDIESDKTFLTITGGPCCGKSSLATTIGYEMYEKGYSYVLWIDMRAITRNPKNPSLEVIALHILQQFNIDTSEMEEDTVKYLRKKLTIIVDNDKSALLIFDNADYLIEPKRDNSGQLSALEMLCNMIRGIQGNSIHCIFTSRLCKSQLDVGHHKIELGYFSDPESRLFVTKELHDFSYQHKGALIEDFSVLSYGLPYALKLMCSEVLTMETEGMIEDYVTDLKTNPVEALDDDSRLTRLFNLSYNRLTSDEKSVFTSMAIFPSTFSYSYLFKVLDNLESVSVNLRILNTLQKHSLLSSDLGRYLIHPFFREFLKNNYWDEDSRETHEIEYYKTYINQLFELAKESLEKDRFVDCLKEFQSEQQCFLHVMREVGKGLTNSQSHIRELLRKILTRTTPEYISVVLFLCHEVRDLYSVALVEFLKGCETFVEGQMKKNIWCCRFDVSMAISEKKIDEDYIELDADEFGQILVAKRKCYQAINGGEFRKSRSRPHDYMKWAKQLEDCKMKAYFTSSILKLEVRRSNSFYDYKQLTNEKKNCLVRYLKDALDICQSSFGVHWLTIDCHTQLGKLHWGLNSRGDAGASFDSAIVLAEPLFATGTRRYLSCLVEKGRFLLLSESKQSVEEGKRLIDQALERCNDFFDEIMYLSAMATYVKVDKKKREEMTRKFLKEEMLSNRWLQIMKSVLNADLDYSGVEVNKQDFMCHEKVKVEGLRQIAMHLEYVCDDSRHKEEMMMHNSRPDLFMCSRHGGIGKDNELLNDARLLVFIYYMKIATKCMHVLSERDTKCIARKALEIMTTYNNIIKPQKKEELLFIISCDHNKYIIMKRACYIMQMGKRIPAMKDKLEEELENVLEDCAQYQDVWSWVIRGLTRENKRMFEKVTPYLLLQSEPITNLLTLMSHKFSHQIEIYMRESDADVIETVSKSAVDDMKRAIKHVEFLLDSNTAMKKESSQALKDALKKWYTQLALRARNVLGRTDRRENAQTALDWMDVGDTIISDKEKEF